SRKCGSRAKRQPCGTSALAISGRHQSPGSAPWLCISRANSGIVIDVLKEGLTSFHKPGLSSRSPFPCQPSSTTAKGRFPPAGISFVMYATLRKKLSAVSWPYVQYQSLNPYTGAFGKRGRAHIVLQNA